MANKFKTNSLILGGELVTTTGNVVFVNGVPTYQGTNPDNFISSGSLALRNSVTGITISGGIAITGAINIVGIYGTNVVQSGNTIGISGGGGGGSVTNNNTYNITGFGVTGISITGGNSLTGQINIYAGTNIVLTQLGNTGFSIAGPAGAGEANTASNLGGGIGVWYDKNGIDLRFNSISGGTGINITLSGNVVFIDSNLNTGQFYPSSNPNQFIPTGSADLRYIQTGVSGEFLKAANLNGLISTGDLAARNYISTGNADLRYLQTGVSGEFLKATNLNGLISTGDLAARNYISTGNADLRYLQTGVSGEFLKAANLNGLISTGDLASRNYISTGNADLRYLQTGVSGEFLKAASLNGLISTGDLAARNYISTGNADLRYLQTGVSGEFLKAASLNGLISTGDLAARNYISTGNADLRYLNSGASGQFYLKSNPDNFISSGDVGLRNVITGASISGGISITGALNINAGSNITLTQAGLNTFSIASTAIGGGSSTNGVTGLSITGGVAISGAISINAGTNVTILQQGLNTFQISSAGGTGGSTDIVGLISTGDADLRYIASGASGLFYLKSNPNNFSSSGNVENTGAALYNIIFPSTSLNLTTGDKLILISGNNTTYTNTVKMFDNGLFSFPSSGKIISVDSIKALRNLNISGIDDNSKVHVKSYYDDSESFVTIFTNGSRDEGGGQFYWNATATPTDDSGRFIRPNSAPPLGRWERLLEGGIPNVHMWGAKGDAYQWTDPVSGRYLLGSDDTIPIQNALNAVHFSYGGTLRFPARIYKVTDTLYWNSQQTQIIGDGTINSSKISMKENIQKDIIRTTSWSGLMAWNENPYLPALSWSSYAGDIPKIKDISIGYEGNSYINATDGGDTYSGLNDKNSTNTVLTMAAVGETNLMQGCSLIGGKYAIRILAGYPGLRAYGCTIVGFGEASISLEGFPTHESGVGYTGWVDVLDGGGGMISLIDCSCDYNGRNSGDGGFSFLKVHNAQYSNVYIKNLKLEGDYPGGVVNYVKPSGHEGRFQHIDINGLNWNAGTATHTVDQTVVVISGADSSVANTVNTSLKNLYIGDVPNLVKDYILKDNTNQPYILKSDNWLGYPHYSHAMPEINHFGTRQNFYNYRGQSGLTYSFVNDTRTNSNQIKFRPMITGWYRIAVGNNSTRTLFNDDLTISYYGGYHKLYAQSDFEIAVGYPNGCKLMSQSTHNNFADVPISRARLFIDSDYASGDSQYKAYIDIFIRSLPNSGVSYNGYDTLRYITIDGKSNNLFGYNNLITPIYLSSGLDILNAVASVNSFPYSEVDLTRTQDISESRPSVAKDAFLIDKDFYLFTTANGDLRYFDAGATISITGGAGSNAAARPIIVQGAIVQTLITNSGNGAYTTVAPIVNVIPNSLNNGVGAALSGFVLNGYLSAISVISGGAGYGFGPNSATDGYSLTGIGETGRQLVSLINGLSGQLNLTGNNLINLINGLSGALNISGGNLYLKSNPNNFISSGDVALRNSVTGASISGGIAITGALNINAGSNITLTQAGLNTFTIASTASGPGALGGVTGISISGGAAISGAVEIVGGYGTNVIQSGNTIVVSGNSAVGTQTNIVGLISTGDADLRYLYTGSSGAFYASSNPNQFIKSGDVDVKLNGLISTGSADLRYLVTGASGAFYLASNPSNYITSVNLDGLISTGQGDLRYLQTGVSGEFYKASNPAAYITSTNLNGLGTTGSFDLRYLQTGVSGEFLKLNNLNGLISTGSHSLINSVTGISISGGLGLTGAININAGSNITITQAGLNTFSIASTAVGGGALGGVTGMSITGGVAISGAINYFGGGDIKVIQSGNSIVVSGSSSAPGAGEANTASNLGNGSGLYSTKSSVDLQFKSLVPGDGVYLSGDNNEIKIVAPRQWFQFTIGSVTLTNMATGQTFLAGSSAYVQLVDLSPFTGVSLSVNKVGTAGQPLSFLFLGYRSAFSATATAYAPLVNSHPKTYIDFTNNIVNSGWFPITQAARSQTYLALLSSGGNGTLDPVVGSIVAYFK
jgi:hypothetical protein